MTEKESRELLIDILRLGTALEQRKVFEDWPAIEMVYSALSNKAKELL